MITAHDGKHPARVRELPLFYILDPGPIDPDGDIMLGFAGNRAGVAADAVAIVAVSYTHLTLPTSRSV